jgi:hypothetical protein
VPELFELVLRDESLLSDGVDAAEVVAGLEVVVVVTARTEVFEARGSNLVVSVWSARATAVKSSSTGTSSAHPATPGTDHRLDQGGSWSCEEVT